MSPPANCSVAKEASRERENIVSGAKFEFMLNNITAAMLLKDLGKHLHSKAQLVNIQVLDL